MIIYMINYDYNIYIYIHTIYDNICIYLCIWLVQIFPSLRYDAQRRKWLHNIQGQQKGQRPISPFVQTVSTIRK